MRVAVACAMLVTTFHAWAQEESLAPRLLQANQLKVAVEQAALQRQYDAFRSMTLEAVEYSPRGPITSVVGQTGIVLPADASLRQKGATATDILPMLKDVLLATGSESLRVQENSVFCGAEKTLELAQFIRGILVINGFISMVFYCRPLIRLSLRSILFVDRRMIIHRQNQVRRLELLPPIRELGDSGLVASNSAAVYFHSTAIPPRSD